jgi:twitching motility protein PilI
MNVIFWLRAGGRWLIPAQLATIQDHPLVRPAPGAPPWLLGACSSGGRAVPVVDVTRLVETPSTLALPIQAAILVELSTGPLALAIDEWRQIRIHQPPHGLNWNEPVSGVHARFLFPERLAAHLSSLLSR